jgi:hypothetical protein
LAGIRRADLTLHFVDHELELGKIYRKLEAVDPEDCARKRHHPLILLGFHNPWCVGGCVIHDTLRYSRPMRVQLRRQRLESGDLWRVCEADGLPVSTWLPTEPFMGALDRGGFGDYQDALAFKFGVDWHRAAAGLLTGLTARDVDRERDVLDEDRRGRTPAPLPIGPLFEAA